MQLSGSIRFYTLRVTYFQNTERRERQQKAKRPVDFIEFSDGRSVAEADDGEIFVTGQVTKKKKIKKIMVTDGWTRR